MQHRQLGSLSPSAIGLHTTALGTELDRSDADRLVGAALDVGLTLFVTGETDADGVAEEHLGRAVGRSRDDVVIVTTVGDVEPPRGVARLTREHVRRCIDASLTRLGRDWIDVVVLRDLEARTSIDETLTALDEQVRAGKVRELAVGEMPAERLEEIVQASEELSLHRPVAVLVDYGPHELGPDDELLPAVAELDLAAVATRSLADGRLVRPDPDHPADGDPDDVVERLRARIDDLARHHGREAVDLALSWTIGRPGIRAAAAGAHTQPQIAELGRVGALALDEIQQAELDERIEGLER